MKKTFSRNTMVFMLAAIVVLSSFSLIADRANFSGDWKLNESKSELGEFGGFAARSLKVDQKENAITIAKTSPGFNGGEPRTTTITVSYDGKVAESEGFGGAKRKSTASWSADEKTLTVSSIMAFERDGQSQEIKESEVWSLTPDGALSVVSRSTTPMGELSTKAIYNK